MTTVEPPAPVECPECHHLSGVVIVWGMPGAELIELSREGRIALGGCVINFEDEVPDRRCRRCHAEWREPTAAG